MGQAQSAMATVSSDASPVPARQVTHKYPRQAAERKRGSPWDAFFTHDEIQQIVEVDVGEEHQTRTPWKETHAILGSAETLSPARTDPRYCIPFPAAPHNQFRFQGKKS